MRALSPLDLDALTASAGRMGRVVVVHEALTFASFGADIAAAVTERCSHLLEAPVQRVGGWNTPYPARADGRAVPARSQIASFGADIAAAVTERCSHLLEAPVQRVGGWNTPYPARADGRAVPARS